VLFGHRRECAVELVGASGLQELKLHAQRRGGALRVFYHERMGGIGRVRKERDAADLGNGLFEQLEPFASYFRADAVGQPRDVPARVRQACDESGPNRIANCHYDDGDRPGGVLGCRHSFHRHRQDDVHLEPDQFGREVGQPVEPSLRISIFDDNILTLNPPKLAQPLPERLPDIWGGGGRAAREITDSGDLARQLRLGGERRDEHTSHRGQQEAATLHHSIT
jgi:hypothetical protein